MTTNGGDSAAQEHVAEMRNMVERGPGTALGSAHHAAAAALRAEAAAMDRLCERLAWAVQPNPEPTLDAPTLRAAADLLDTLET